jgi:dethiobiotin synthetase
MSGLIVSGTGTEIGKTIATAAVAAAWIARGDSVCVVKPAQTGLQPLGHGDAHVVRELAGVDRVDEYVRYPDPLAPASAARRAGLPTLDLKDCSVRLTTTSNDVDHLLVEGAGGLLVRFADEPAWSMRELAQTLDWPVLVVARAALGTLNDIALTLEALRSAGVTCAGIVIGSWPREPGLAERSNLLDIAQIGGRIVGVLPDGAGQLDQASFRRAATGWVDASLGGSFDAADFIRDHSA